MALEKYTRSQLEHALKVIHKKQQEVKTYLAGNHLTDTIHTALKNELTDFEALEQHIKIRLEALHASCIFCRERQTVEVPTITFVCKTCDDTIFGGMKR